MGLLFAERVVPGLKMVCRCLALSLSLLMATACTTDPDESGVVGTGIMLRGTVSDQTQLASTELEIKSQAGDRSTASVARDGQYLATSLSGQGPWLLRSDIGNDTYQYGIAHASGVVNEGGYVDVVAHVNGYTDVIVRAWILDQHSISDLDVAFDTEQGLPRLPARQEFLSDTRPYMAAIELILEDYEITALEFLEKEHRNDGTGIDRFLNENPVVLERREIDLIRTDPDNGFQSYYHVDILLGGIRQMPDTAPPTPPENLRAFKNPAGGIQLIWDASTDNSAIYGYEIERNGDPIKTTPYVAYIDDTELTNLDYVVYAIDIAKNRSAGASISLDVTSIVSGTEIPPAPRDLIEVLSTTRQVEFSWTQDNIGSVVGYDVYRGLTPDALSKLGRVTSTSMVDATVSSALQYWYAIRAIGASSQESALSEPLVVMTDGITIELPQVQTSPLADLNVPDTEFLSCETAFPVYNIDDTRVSLSPGCYQVEQNINVVNFGVLTLEPGVILKFEPVTGIKVEYTGILKSVGTAAMPVTMTASRQTRGWWSGVWFNHTENPANQISHTVIEYAGAEPTGASILLESATNDPAFLSVENSLIRHGRGYGIDIPGLDGRLQSFSSNLITQNDRAAAVNHSSLPAINDGSVFSENDNNFIYVSRAYYALDIELFDPGIPLILNSIDQEPSNPPHTIIINEGVEMRFTSGDAFNVHGNLAIRGTASNPVKLTSKNPNPGGWEGLQLLEGANAQLSHVIIENAGQPSEENPAGASLFANNARLELENVTLRFSASYGFHAAGDCVTVAGFERVSSNNNAREDITDPTNLIPCL